jgi:hypothetical protein
MGQGIVVGSSEHGNGRKFYIKD